MADPTVIKERLEALVGHGSVDRLRRLLVEDLNFHPADEDALALLPQSHREGVQSIRIIARQDEFYVIFCLIDRLLKGKERPIAEKVAERYAHSLVIFTVPANSEWHFTNIKQVTYKGELFKRFRRIIVGSTERLRTASDRLARIEVEDTDSSLLVHDKCNKAFDVQEVTREFYRDFVLRYKEFRLVLKKKNKLDDGAVDALTQSIFNRLFFLYFIQKMRFLDGKPDYLLDSFKTIHGEYYKDFLLPLFKKLSDADNKDKRFERVPFLNGGLFEFDPLEDKITIPNEAFKDVFGELFEKYNFTVREDTEFEQEVAIDPEMLGTVFEQLILGLEKEDFKDIPDARRQTGSYYTRKFIVAFMVKQSLLNYLSEAFPQDRKKLKELVFSLKTDHYNPKELGAIKDRLLDIKIVDPGAGSGAFPVGILLKMVEITEAIDKRIAPAEAEKDGYRYRLKRAIIERNIYGVDIQARAVNLANLRLWLSLIVDSNVKSAKEVEPLPNLDYHIIRGDSLLSKIGDIDFDLERHVKIDAKGSELLDRLTKLKKEYEDLRTKAKKLAQTQKIEKAKKELFVWFLKRMLDDKEKELFNLTGSKFDFMKEETLFTAQEEKEQERLKTEIQVIRDHIKNADNLVSSFNWGLDFYEVLGLRQGFDIVIGNPPYGIKVDESVENDFALGNKDSYGVFTALGMKLLRPGGTLCYIMSDTWQTIKTHKQLRDKLLSEADCQYLISCPSDTFGAVVNVGVYAFKKRLVQKEGGENWMLAADFSPLSIEDGHLEAAFEILIEHDSLDDTKDGYTLWSDRDMAIYAYRQKLITRFSNHSFFIASPKLFGLMRDVGNVKVSLRENEQSVCAVDFNGKEVVLVKLGNIAEVKKGIDTGENSYFLMRSTEESGGDIDIVDERLVLTRHEVEHFSQDEKLYGVTPSRFGGRYLVPYDKGGSSDVGEGWLPNYHVKTGFFLKWSKAAVKELRKRTERVSGNHKATIRNEGYWFKEGITFSSTGVYAPTFRLNSAALFDNKGSTCYCERIDQQLLLGIFCSKLARFLFKVFIQHNVEFAVDALTWLPIVMDNKVLDHRMTVLTSAIITKQKQDPRYDYMTNEQQEIDRLVYQMYNLNEDDIAEVENWFFRRYPKLARVIEEKMKAKAGRA